MRLDLPPAFFLRAYIRLAMLGGLGLFVLGLGAAFTPQAPGLPGTAGYGVAQAIVGVLVFALHDWWLMSAPETEYEVFLRRAHAMLGALAFLAGLAVFFPLALGRTLAGADALGQWIVALLSAGLAAYFAWRLQRELPSAA